MKFDFSNKKVFTMITETDEERVALERMFGRLVMNRHEVVRFTFGEIKASLVMGRVEVMKSVVRSIKTKFS